MTGTEAAISLPHQSQTKIAQRVGTPRPFLRTRPHSSLSYPARSYRAEIALLLHFGRPRRYRKMTSFSVVWNNGRFRLSAPSGRRTQIGQRERELSGLWRAPCRVFQAMLACISLWRATGVDSGGTQARRRLRNDVVSECKGRRPPPWHHSEHRDSPIASYNARACGRGFALAFCCRNPGACRTCRCIGHDTMFRPRRMLCTHLRTYGIQKPELQIFAGEMRRQVHCGNICGFRARNRKRLFSH
jgi:hypothetical protein